MALTLILKRHKKKRSRQKGKVYGGTVTKVYTPPVKITAGWKDDPTLDATLEFPPNLFAEFLYWQTINPNLEISVIGAEVDGVLVAIRFVAADSAAFVSVSGEAVATAELQIIELGYKPNVHLHTHPSFSAFWSGVDETQQVGRVKSALQVGIKEGRMMFVVVGLKGEVDNVVRTVKWNDGSVSYRDGNITVDGRSFVPPPKKVVVTTGTAVANKWSTTYSKNGVVTYSPIPRLTPEELAELEAEDEYYGGWGAGRWTQSMLVS